MVRTWCVLYILTSKCVSRQVACHFSTSKLPKVLRSWGVLNILTWKCVRAIAACNFSTFSVWFFRFWLGNVLRATTVCNVLFLIGRDGSAPAALASLLFDPPDPQIIGKSIVFRDFPNISRTCIFFLLALSLFCSSLFYSSLFCSSRLCFSSLHVVGSLTSKLPLISVDFIFGCLFFMPAATLFTSLVFWFLWDRPWAAWLGLHVSVKYFFKTSTLKGIEWNNTWSNLHAWWNLSGLCQGTNWTTRKIRFKQPWFDGFQNIE